MKLSRDQAAALASKIANKTNDVNRKTQEALLKTVKSTPAYKKTEQQFRNILKTMPEALFDALISAYSGTTKESIVEYALVKEYAKAHETKRVSDNEIMNDIILASIDSDSIEEITRKLKSKYVIPVLK